MTTVARTVTRPRPSWNTPTTGAGTEGGARVLVAFASRHGSTREIAAALVRALPRTSAGRHGRLTAVLVPVQRHPDPTAFDAVVLGSAVYADSWLEPARRYADSVSAALRSRPTWLFSTGLAADGRVAGVDGLRESLDPRGHRAFAGRVEPRLLSAAERSTWSRPAASEGDFRNWSAVDAWAEEIAGVLALRSPAALAG